MNLILRFFKSSIYSLYSKINTILFLQAKNQYAEDGTHKISLKINEKCWRNFKFSSQVKILVILYSCDVTSFHQKLKNKNNKGK
jgi:hypothetical protein